YFSISKLENTSTAMIINGRKVLVDDSPLTPRRDSWAFQYNLKAADWSAIPLHTDVLVIHGPPAHHLELNGSRCQDCMFLGIFMHEGCRD
ncbi:hypothetical protein EV368DRAFT_39930, partial [Lentinula lateritia]